MRTLNKYIASLFVAVSLLFASCEKDEAINSSVAECSWQWSSDETDLVVSMAVNKYISIMNLSVGELSHEWQIPEDAGIYFIAGLSWGDNDYENFIVGDAKTTTDSTIHLYFTEPGQHIIRLYNTYNKQVTYPYAEWNSITAAYDYFTMTSEYIDGKHVMDVEFTMDIYDSVLVPQAEVYYDSACTQPVTMGIIKEATYDSDGKIVTAAEYKTVTVEYGDTLYYKDTSTDRPNTWTWSCSDLGYYNTYSSIEKLGSVIPVTYQQLTNAPDVGIETDPFVMQLQVVRTDTQTLSGDKYVPTATAVTAYIPLSVEVVPSTAALAYTVEEIDQNTLQLNLVNSEFRDGATIDDMSKFEVYWENDFEGAAFLSGYITPTSITVSADDSKVATIVLPDMIYNTDRVWFYMHDGAEVELAMFDGASLSIAKTTDANVFVTYADVPELLMDFETEGEAESLGWCVGASSEEVAPSIAPDFFCENPMKTNYPTDFEAEWNNNKSERCLMVDGTGDTACIVLYSPTFSNPITTKLYFEFQTYADPSTTLTDGLSPAFNTLSSGQNAGAYNEWSTNGWLDQNALAPGAWQSHSVEITVEDNVTEYTDLRLTMRFNGIHDILYFDNFSFRNVEERTRE